MDGAVEKLVMEEKVTSLGEDIDKVVDDVFGPYCVKQPTFVIKKSRIGVIMKRDNSLALLYQDKGQIHKGKKYYPVELRKINGKGSEVKWMAVGSFSLL